VPPEDIDLISLPLGDEGVEVTLLDLARLVDMDSIASRMLASPEREEYARLGHPGRRREWLGARVCLKGMLRRRGSVSDPKQCAVLKDGRGRPWLSFASGRPAPAVHDCSLSHKGRYAVAATSGLAHTRIGVDIEEVSIRLLKVADAFVGDGDEPTDSRPPEVRLATLWALKEACAKAGGGGLGFALGDIACRETDTGRHRVLAPDGREFRAWTVLREGYVVALCLGADPPARPVTGRAEEHGEGGA